MATEEQANLFLFYADYYAYATEAGLNRARALFPGIAISRRVNIRTVINKPNSRAAETNLTQAFDTAYEHIWSDAQERGSLQDAWLALSTYILEQYGADIDTFLTENGIQVEPLYATLANIYGEEIQDSNIEGN